MLTDLTEKELQLLVAAAYFCGTDVPKPDHKKVQQEMGLASTGAANKALSRARAKLFKGRDGESGAGEESPKKSAAGKKRKDAGDGEETPSKAKKARGKKAKDEEVKDDGASVKAEKDEDEDDEA